MSILLPTQPIPTAAPSLRIVRHAQPWVAPGVCYGRLDVAADPAHTQRTAHDLFASWDGTPVLLLHSPLQRCVQLCEALQACLGTAHGHWTVRAEPRLAEMDFGQWEGQTWETIGAVAIDAWTQDFLHYRPGGGECVAHFLERVGQVWQASQQHMAMHGQSVWWISHAGVARAAHCWQQGVALEHASDWPAVGLSYGQWQDWPLFGALP